MDFINLTFFTMLTNECTRPIMFQFHATKSGIGYIRGLMPGTIVSCIIQNLRVCREIRHF